MCECYSGGDYKELISPVQEICQLSASMLAPTNIIPVNGTPNLFSILNKITSLKLLMFFFIEDLYPLYLVACHCYG